MFTLALASENETHTNSCMHACTYCIGVIIIIIAAARARAATYLNFVSYINENNPI